MIITPHTELSFISYDLWKTKQILSIAALDPDVYRTYSADELGGQEAWSFADYFVDSPIFRLDGISYSIESVTLGKDLDEATVNFSHFLKRQRDVVLYRIYQTLGDFSKGDTSKFVIKARMTVLNNARSSWDSAAALLT